MKSNIKKPMAPPVVQPEELPPPKKESSGDLKFDQAIQNLLKIKPVPVK